MQLLVSGTRNGHPDVEAVLDEWVRDYGEPELVIVGCASGVDDQVRRWAQSRKYPLTVIFAEWEKYGRAKAGKLRNQRMVDKAKPGDHAIAFPGQGNGTYDFIGRVRRRHPDVTLYIHHE